MPSTFKARFMAAPAQADAFAALVCEVIDPPPAVSVAESGAARLVELYFTERPDPALLQALFRDAAGGEGSLDLQVSELPEENWVTLVQRGLHPVRAGGFFIHGSHDRAQACGRFAIEIDAGQAFGTAHHGTTRGCLLAIGALARRQRWRRVLDVGTGTGVLAIAAAKAAPCRVLASDIDPVAVQVAAGNIRKNGVRGQVRPLLAASAAHAWIKAGAPYDLITANILANPLVRLAPRLASLAASGAHIVLSGLLDPHTREVLACYRRLGLALEARVSLEGWTTLILVRRSEKAAGAKRGSLLSEPAGRNNAA
jgi:ribosomal protein L11 methyltransferase